MLKLEYGQTIDVGAIAEAFDSEDVPWTVTTDEAQRVDGDNPTSFVVQTPDGEVYFNLPDIRQFEARASAGLLDVDAMLYALLYRNKEKLKTTSSDSLINVVTVDNSSDVPTLAIDVSDVEDGVYNMSDIIVDNGEIFVTRLTRSGESVQAKFEEKREEARTITRTA